MKVWLRLLSLGVCLSILVIGLSIVNKTQLKQLSEPLILVIILDSIILLGLLTYSPGRLWNVFCGIFIKNSFEDQPTHRRVIGQMALYALISGMMLSVIYVLVHLGRISENLSRHGDASELRLPLMTLLYGVLAAVGLWAASGMDKPDPKEIGSTERNQVVMGFGVLLLTVGVLSLLIVGMNHLAGSGGFTGNIPIESVQGLHRGEDMIWRPVRLDQKSMTERQQGLLPNDSDVAAFPISRDLLEQKQVVHNETEPPLRWDLNVDADRHHRHDRLTIPAIKQN